MKRLYLLVMLLMGTAVQATPYGQPGFQRFVITGTYADAPSFSILDEYSYVPIVFPANGSFSIYSELAASISEFDRPFGIADISVNNQFVRQANLATLYYTPTEMRIGLRTEEATISGGFSFAPPPDIMLGRNEARQLFIFRPGTYEINDSLSITISAIPEPQSWLLLIAGFGAIGAGMRRKQIGKIAYATG